ncbi:LLM class flavin-dependent oxidoreductase [Planosporangium thailandense]|uniref:LLM class flavin-dependent oxidoreductase n=1 Tax=Planosporangium thailandense TaxID=765197 RepID=A0ABX0XTA7_9ACTN|nr:LLM class flavin-dependent oxidoreductase [Planosporangium thailandense]NJC68577.1 LLM class flavin-dependent oxidoreductase [Planosporangium thailandense]
MTDYGHELLFGSFLTPIAQQPEQAVALTQLSEQAGLDLATFQDHPYQPGFLDTWTLLSYLAAATSSIRLAPNVLNLPLRQPVVVARSAASLDLLSGGRVELGLGAGAFWEAIEAAGGRRLTPGQAVDALAEAITIIREVWAADQRGGVRVKGDHYQVVGAKRGPAPAHDIGVWVGAYKPRMLRLVGRMADGWLPSLTYLPKGPAELVDLNAYIDEGAAAAGRDPRSVRRLLNIAGEFTASGSGLLTGPPSQWVEELAGLALDHGISGFLLMGDDPLAIQRFGQEVAPAVRELVAAERRDPGRRTKSAEAAPEPVPAGGDAVFATTPPPASRYSRRRLWDESTRPVAPPAPAGHVYTEHAQAVGQHLVDVHDHLRRELTQVRDLLEQVKRGAVSVGRARAALGEMTMRQNNWTLGAYCASYCTLLTQHHGIEDQSIFPHLRRADAGLVPVIDRLEQEHVIIHEVVEGVDRALVNLVNHPQDFSELQEAVDILTDTLLSHLSYEERQIVEPLARYGFYAGQV